MSQLAAPFTTSGIELERAGGPPLYAVEVVGSDGRLLQASVVDPALFARDLTEMTNGGAR